MRRPVVGAAVGIATRVRELMLDVVARNPWLVTCLCGGDEGDRTLDLRIANAALSQLSYVPTGVKL